MAQQGKMHVRRCCLLLSFFALHVLSAAPLAAATTTTTNYNCSQNYTLRVGNKNASGPPQQSSSSDPATRCTDENTSRTASCVLSSQDGFQQCRSLSEILSQSNGEIGSSDCLLLELEQGEYAISPFSTVSVDYSLVMVAVDSGEVTVSCSDQTQPSRTAVPKSSCASTDPTVPLMFGRSEGRDWGEVVVVLDGIGFQDCPRPLQFDDLDRVTITDSWFR